MGIAANCHFFKPGQSRPPRSKNLLSAESLFCQDRGYLPKHMDPIFLEPFECSVTRRYPETALRGVRGGTRTASSGRDRIRSLTKKARFSEGFQHFLLRN